MQGYAIETPLSSARNGQAALSSYAEKNLWLERVRRRDCD
jgi:hypothetical protein